MAYNKNKPQGTDSWLSSQRSLQQNFQSIYDTFTSDHEAFDNENEGMHKKCTFKPQTSTPVESLNDSLVLFNAISALTGVNELNMLRVSNNTVQPLTERDQNAGVASGWMKLPSGIIIKWGVELNTSGFSPITFPTGGTYPAFNNIYNAYITYSITNALFADRKVHIKSITTTQIDFVVQTLNGTGAFTNVYYIAIGD